MAFGFVNTGGGAASSEKTVLVDALPEAAAGCTGKLYVVQHSSPTGSRAYVCIYTGPATGYMWFEVGAYGLVGTESDGLLSAEDYTYLMDAADMVLDGAMTRYGVRFEGSANSGATVRRLFDAVGLVADVGTDTEKPPNDFDNIYPWSARRRCCGAWDESGNFTVNAYKGEPGYAEDGTNGEVWVEHSLFYYRHTYTDDGAEEIVISATPLADYLPAPIFVGSDGAVHQKAYTAAYPMATVNGKATSRSGVFADDYSLNTAMESARTLGANYTVTTSAEWYTECLYMWVEFATRGVQSVMAGATGMDASGVMATVSQSSTNRFIVANADAEKFAVGQTVRGTTPSGSFEKRIVTSIEEYDANNRAICFDGDPLNISDPSIIYSDAWKNGSCDNVIASSGSPVSNTSGKYNCIYRGKESPYGNSAGFLADLLLKREGSSAQGYTYGVYFLPDPTKYTDGTVTDSYTKLNYTAPSSAGYVSRLGCDSRFPFVRVPSEAGASASTYYSDRYQVRGTLCAARVGGGLGDGTSAGPLCFDCRSAPSSANSGSARLSYRR